MKTINNYVIVKTKKELKGIMYDEEVARRIEMNEIEERGIEIGKKQGIEIGKEQGIEIGKNEERNRIIKLLSKELSIEEISKKMEISIEEIENVLNNEKSAH